MSVGVETDFMATLTGMFLLVYFILPIQGKHIYMFFFFLTEFMTAFHLGGSIKQVGYVNESGLIL